MLREHIRQFYTNLKPKFSNLKELLESKIISKKSMKKFKDEWFLKDNKMPNSIAELDISKSFALIKNIFMGNGFGYSQDKYEYVDQLREIRNGEYGHMLIFETDDIAFSTAVVRLEEIIRKLCDYDQCDSEYFLSKVEKELEKDSCQINEQKSSTLKMLLEQKEEFRLFISDLDSKLKQSSDQIMKSFSEKLLSFEKGLSMDNFEKLIQEMKGNEESRNHMLQVSISEMNSTLSKIESGNFVNFKLKLNDNCIIN